MSGSAGAIRIDGQFRYVPIGSIGQFHRDGWMVIDALGNIHHGHYAVLMWRCDCEAVAPIDDAAGQDDSRAVHHPREPR
ncbi:MAG: hypothetical protein O9972_14305 [Burkholderiales bacterium]|nr:hypothetical protein [Burkholderiales bacterium]